MTDERERVRRWRLLLGAPAENELATLGAADEPGEGDGDGPGRPTTPVPRILDRRDQAMDAALAALYDGDPDRRDPRRRGGLGASSPSVARWLGDIRSYFPSSVVQVMQRDAIDRLHLRQLLLEPEMLASVEPDVHLVGTLLSLTGLMPDQTLATARTVVAKVVADIERRIANRTRAAVAGALNRATRSRRPRLRDVDWNRTIAANLKHYQPEYRTVIPERMVGYGRRQQVISRDIVLAIDQSGSMAASIVFASVFGAVLASLRAVRTSLVVFDTAVVDLTDQLDDPVALLFGTQLGGGTDINKAIGYCQTLVTRPRDTILVLISDLIEGGVQEELLARVAALVDSGVTVVALLALSDEGAPVYDVDNAAALAELGVPAFACTPDAFPDLLSVAIEGGDIAAWAHRNDLAAR
jgi:Mg-chelatase subunit ChlD